MVAKAEEIKILEKVVDLAKKELNPVEYAKFLAIITPKVGDSVKEIRKFRDTVSEEEFMEMLKKKGAKIIP
jgi:ubiquinone biosynthesis protein Coq4